MALKDSLPIIKHATLDVLSTDFKQNKMNKNLRKFSAIQF